MPPAAPSFPPCRKRRGRKGALVTIWCVLRGKSRQVLIFSRYEHTNSPYGRYGTRRLLRYTRSVSNCVLISAVNQLCVQNPQSSTNSPKALVGAGLCSARQKAQDHRKSSADSYVPAHSAVGADAHISPLGSHESAEDFRKTGTFCGRTESSAPTGESEDRCRGRRLLSAHWEAVNSPQSPKASPCRAPRGKGRWHFRRKCRRGWVADIRVLRNLQRSNPLSQLR